MQSFRRLTAAPAIRSLLARPPTVSSRQFVRRLTQSNHTHGSRSSDLPWIIGAVGFTIPASFYLLSSSSKPAHHSPAGHGDGHGHATEAKDSKAASVAEEEDEDSSPEEAEATKQPDSTDSKNQDTEESSSDAHDQASETTEETGEKAAEVEGEGETKGKSDEHTGGEVSDEDEDETKNGKKVDGEGKGKTSDDGGKKPVVKKEEKAGKETKSQTLERLNREKPSRKPSDIDPPAAGMKDVASPNMQSGKQEGISNKDTWHSVLHSERGQSISKKAEGAHETAKLKGTVDPFRPANYDATKK